MLLSEVVSTLQRTLEALPDLVDVHVHDLTDTLDDDEDDDLERWLQVLLKSPYIEEAEVREIKNVLTEEYNNRESFSQKEMLPERKERVIAAITHLVKQESQCMLEDMRDVVTAAISTIQDEKTIRWKPQAFNERPWDGLEYRLDGHIFYKTRSGRRGLISRNIRDHVVYSQATQLNIEYEGEIYHLELEGENRKLQNAVKQIGDKLFEILDTPDFTLLGITSDNKIHWSSEDGHCDCCGQSKHAIQRPQHCVSHILSHWFGHWPAGRPWQRHVAEEEVLELLEAIYAHVKHHSVIPMCEWLWSLIQSLHCYRTFRWLPGDFVSGDWSRLRLRDSGSRLPMYYLPSGLQAFVSEAMLQHVCIPQRHGIDLFICHCGVLHKVPLHGDHTLAGILKGLKTWQGTDSERLKIIIVSLCKRAGGSYQLHWKSEVPKDRSVYKEVPILQESREVLRCTRRDIGHIGEFL